MGISVTQILKVTLPEIFKNTEPDAEVRLASPYSVDFEKEIEKIREVKTLRADTNSEYYKLVTSNSNLIRPNPDGTLSYGVTGYKLEYLPLVLSKAETAAVYESILHGDYKFEDVGALNKLKDKLNASNIDVLKREHIISEVTGN